MALPLQHARLDAAQIAAAANAHDRPAAIVCNAHITGLAVARSLARRGVPVIGLDREPYGVALASNAVVAAAVCHDPITVAPITARAVLLSPPSRPKRSILISPIADRSGALPMIVKGPGHLG